MRILIIGLGSIGKRHLSILNEIEDVEVAALRTSKGTLKEPEEGVKEFHRLKEALDFAPEGVIVSNPTSLHIESAMPFLKEGIRVLIEKPVAHSIEEAEKLKPYSEYLRVAYCLRFLPLYQELKKRFQKEAPFKVGFKRSFYLPHWHPYADYRKEYVAQKELGGGVIRTLSHEIDLAIDWFGVPSETNGVVDKLSFLEMDADDYAFFSMKTAGGSRINLELDLYSPININQGEAFTEQGKYAWDMSQISFTAYEEKKTKVIFSQEPEEVEGMYRNQMKDFLRFVETGKSINTSLQEALETLATIESIEK